MHQMKLAQRLSNEILAQTSKEKPITIKVGELLNINPQELIDLLEVLGHKNVSIKTLPSLVKCKCGYEGPAEIYHKNHDVTLFRCPKCHAQPTVEKGEELKFEFE